MERKPWRCRVGWHRWIRRYDVEGQRYVGCARCPKRSETPPFYPIVG